MENGKMDSIMKTRLTYGLLAALMVCGCQKEDLNISVSEPKTFTAAIEDNYSGGATKTSLDENGNVLWKRGDQVSVFAGSTINEQYQVTDGSDGKTSANLNRVSTPDFVAGGEIDNNVAYYPYSSSNVIAKSENGYKVGVILPSTQSYAEASFANGAFPMAAITSSTDDMNLKFKNVLGGLKLQLKGSASIASISLSGNNNEILCGAADISLSTADVPSITLVDASAKTITLDCGAGVQLNDKTAKSFILALPPMTLASGFTVIITDTDGKQMTIKTEKSQVIKRSSLLKMPVKEFEATMINGHEYVDLGLSVKWATCNVGASKPEQYGDYYAWGEIETKSEYSWSTYKWCKHNNYSSDVIFTKYCISGSYDSYKDYKKVLDKQDDVANVKWSSKWRMPTNAEWKELTDEDNCSWTKTNNYNETGVAGYIVTSKKPGFTDRSIFLPAAGNYYETNLEAVGTGCCYWSSSLYSNVTANDILNRQLHGSARFTGQSVRPVCE